MICSKNDMRSEEMTKKAKASLEKRTLFFIKKKLSVFKNG